MDSDTVPSSSPLPAHATAPIVEDQDAREPDETWEEDVASLFISPPPGPIHLQKGHHNQSLAVSWTALSSWIRQPAPVCAAAAIAGAFNACHGGRGAPEAIKDVNTTLGLLKQLLLERMDSVRERVKRRCGPNVKEFEASFAQELVLRCPGRSVGGKGDKGIGSKEGKRILYDLIARTRKEFEPEESSSSSQDQEVDICTLLSDLLPPLQAAAGGQEEEGAGVEGEEENDPPSSVSLAPKGGIAIDIPTFAGKKKKAARQKGNSLAQELLEDLIDLLVGKPSGIEKISAPRPSTAAFGTWAIVQGVEQLGLKATIVMQRGSSPRIGGAVSSASEVSFISDDDDEDQQDRQWSALARELMKEKTALIFHLTNHYALLYALRERVEEEEGGEGTRRVREVLTARRGQRPTAWIPFSECRRIILSWSQYVIIRVEKV